MWSQHRLRSCIAFSILSICSLTTGFSVAAESINACQQNTLPAAFTHFMKDYSPLQQGQFSQIKTLHKYNARIKTSGQFELDDHQLIWTTLIPQESQVTLSQDFIKTRIGEKIISTPMAQDSFGAVLFKMMNGIFQLDLTDLQTEFQLTVENTDQDWSFTLSPCGQLKTEILKIDVALKQNSPRVLVDILKVNQDEIELELQPK